MRLCRTGLAAAMALAASMPAWAAVPAATTVPGFFALELLQIDGRDVTRWHGTVDLQVPANGKTTITIALSFSLAHPGEADPSKMFVACTSRRSGWPLGPENFAWSPACEYDAKSGRGVFRVAGFPLERRCRYDFSVDVSRVAPQAPQTPVYTFFIETYPSLGRTARATLPFYVIDDLAPDTFLHYPAAVFANMNRAVPPNTSFYICPSIPEEHWPLREPVAPLLKIVLVKLEPEEPNPFRPLLCEADLPKGEETLIYDGAAGGDQNGFRVEMDRIREGGDSLSPGGIWIRKPRPAGPAYENESFLEPGHYYSVQYELAREPYAGHRYEGTRFGVRPEPAASTRCEMVADFAAGNFVDWHGDWYNGHLIPRNQFPIPDWGEDFVMQKRDRDRYPDLWRALPYGSVEFNFSEMFNDFINLYRDRSIRAVKEVRQETPARAVLRLGHVVGADHYHDPDDPDDAIASHPVIGGAAETVFRAGDALIVQTKGDVMEAKVIETRPESDELVIETPRALWAVKAEGRARRYPAVLGEPGSPPASVTLPARNEGTYLRLRNGRPYVNWGILNSAMDFFVDTMEFRPAIARYMPHEFTGDAFTGKPSAAGWQSVSDCEYYFVRHLLRRYRADLDTFSHILYGEGAWQAGGATGYVPLYDYLADGILRAYEEVLGVKGEDYHRVRIGMGGVTLEWGQDYLIRNLLAHSLPAPLEEVFPPGVPERWNGDLPTVPQGTNPLYCFGAEERRQFLANRWDFNACFLDGEGEPVVGPSDWDAQGKLTAAAVARLEPGWRHSRWLLENTRFGKGTPFRSVSYECYGQTAEGLAKQVLFEKELLAQLDRNLRASGGDAYVQDYLETVNCGVVQLALFDWAASGTTPLGRPFQGSGYWPAYFADTMRRILDETARHSPGIFNWGTFTFDVFIGPDASNSGCCSDTAGFQVSRLPRREWVDLGGGKRIEVARDFVTVEKDIRHFIRFIGMMTHRLAALPEQTVAGHTVGGVISKRWDDPPAGVETGNGPGDERRFWVLLYDHYAPDLESQDALEIPVRLRLANLPPEAKQARVTVYRIDTEHGSLWPLTENADHAARRKAQEALPLLIRIFKPLIYTAEEVARFREASRMKTDESFAQKGGVFDVSGGGLELDLQLAANRVLFVAVEW